ncbi:hypothetical protein C8Q76DRAFT_668791 [Earliella scabrosa]|nr:hypothetical protein C8Q76DRAFT_668791 [Earliella scabrosa]
MSRYHSSAPYPPSGNAEPTTHDPARADLPRHDRDPSPSGSDSSSAFNNYPDNNADDLPASDDPYHALTSQTLNADGTPKRPMNAFMIFARKRRPQISAANQMMRTGDVSKILSKEWNSMEMSEKKFYLDQAKKLKDNFNSKYPDYVYRRRPNNSRKKRKTEANHDDPADAHLGDPDDPAYDDPSPIDGDDALMVPQDVQYTRPHPLNPSPPMYHPHDSAPPASNPAASCTYPYSSDFHPAHPSRLPHLHSDPSLSSAGSIGPIRTSSLDGVGSLAQGYHSQHSLYQNPAHHPSHLYPTTHGALAGWEPSASRTAGGSGGRADPARTSWPVLPALDTNVTRQRAVPSVAGKAEAYSPSLPARPWSSATSSSSSSASTSQHYGAGANAFPTLNSAFFPNESPPSSKPMDLASPGTTAPHAHDYFPSAAAVRRSSQEAAYGTQYGTSPAGWSQHQQQQQQQYGRSGASQRGVAGLHAISPYSLHGSPESGSRSASASSAHSAAPLGYWDDRFGGR